REMAFIATAETPDGGRETLGVVRGVSDLDNRKAEFAIIVLSQIKEKGLGRRLLVKMINYLKERGIQELVAEVLIENQRMLALARSLGFKQRRSLEGGIVRISLDLQTSGAGRTENAG
ncbi:MAG TPA: GNAT family N-acetyltransferase, partial [Proteobacteria bacterium]|nr:GNAT family N-acetyltransferase [Pseudomonadota bacterium]